MTAGREVPNVEHHEVDRSRIILNVKDKKISSLHEIVLLAANVRRQAVVGAGGAVHFPFALGLSGAIVDAAGMRQERKKAKEIEKERRRTRNKARGGE